MNRRASPRRPPARQALRAIAVVLALPGGLAWASPPGEAPPVWAGRFDDASEPWRELRLKPELKPNTFTRRDWEGHTALEVRSSGSMSLMARPLDVDLAHTPVLCWRWRVDAPLQRADIGTRAGDDVAARLYVSLALPDAAKGFALRTKLALARAVWGADLPDAAINYVWDNRRPVGSEQPNAYTDRATMVVLRSGSADAGRWVQERRDLAADIARLWGAGARPVQLAVTADTDNTGETARAGFADIHLVAAGQACR